MRARAKALLRFVASGRPFRTLAAVLGAVAVAISIVLGVRQLLPDPEPASYSVLVVVDTSEAMERRFGRHTKFEAVRREVVRFARHSPGAAIAVRFTGGVCSTEYDPPVIAFEEDNASAIETAFVRRTPDGVTDFASAITEGVDDFRQSDAVRESPSQSIWAFLGSPVDFCTRNAADQVQLALEGFGSKAVRFNFFGVGASERERRRLARLLTGLRDAGYEARVRTPRTLSELRESVEDTVLRETPSE